MARRSREAGCHRHRWPKMIRELRARKTALLVQKRVCQIERKNKKHVVFVHMFVVYGKTSAN